MSRKKRSVFFIFIFAFTIFIMGMMRTSPEFHLYNHQLLKSRLELGHVQNIFEISPLDNHPNVRYNVKDIRNIVPDIRPRTVKTPEMKLFKKVNHDVIFGLQNKNWTEWEDRHCSGNFYNFKGSIMLMNNVIIDPLKKRSVAKGGEDIQSVIGHTEKDEEVTVQSGFFNILCKELPKVTFRKRSHFYNWFSGISTRKGDYDGNSYDSTFAVLIRRGDYANLYWTLMELFNTYLTIRLLGENPKTTDVILMDAHPAGKLDNLWSILFGNVYRIGHMKKKRFHKKLAWVLPDGPMSQYVQNVPFVEEFKYALYQGVQNSSSLYHNCTESQKVTFILRKDYVAHPRNPKGKVQRKLSNEKEIMDYLVQKFPKAHIHAIQIDLLPIEEQIKLIYETTILIGIHGAGLGHTLLLRSGSTMIELFPSSYKRSPNPHFQQFAYWADVHYDRWYSSSPAQKSNEWVYVQPEVPFKIINHAIDRFCKH
ncbi:glycoprotein 2-beta-D-xylosyltransferase [Mytilus galloprovincialis]|uniref:EGF domain-specific O-linked N-acetylglucosamine transferase n=2 Tax=Mytilus galloprovincialis TaxID=29158 RepID=A0A8B6FH64_MYTGA|nr:glycoprotein 2-beta-D-xylosyltransferase [Mytilus galloprovincialis]